MNNEGGPGDLIDSGGGLIEIGTKIAEASAAGSGAEASKLRKAGMYNKQQNLLKLTSNAKRAAIPIFKVATHSLTVISWVFDAAD